MRQSGWMWGAVLVSGVLAVAAGVAALLLGRIGWGYYRQLNGTRLDPLGTVYHEFAEVAVEKDAGILRVVFFGDSRAEAWPAPDLPGFHFLNRAISGQTSAQVAGRFGVHVAPLQPDIVLVQVCVNDLDSIPLYPHLEAEIVANCQANLDSIVAQSRAVGAQVILTTVFPTGRVSLRRRIAWSGAIDAGIVAVNDYIRSLAAPDLFVLDTVPILADETGRVRRDYAADFLHLTPTGYAALNEALGPLLRKMKPE